MTSSHIKIDSVLVRDGETSMVNLHGGIVVLSVSAGSYFNFNEVGSEIWNLLGEPCCVGRIFAELSKRYDVDAQTLAREVVPFLQKLIEHRLIEVREPGHGR